MAAGIAGTAGAAALSRSCGRRRLFVSVRVTPLNRLLLKVGVLGLLLLEAEPTIEVVSDRHGSLAACGTGAAAAEIYSDASGAGDGAGAAKAVGVGTSGIAAILGSG